MKDTTERMQLSGFNQSLTFVRFFAAPSATTGIASVVDDDAPEKLHPSHF